MERKYRPKMASTRWTCERELEVLKAWEEERPYEFKYSPQDPREVIAIDTPPPYASGKWHVGGAAHYVQIDMIARYFRMKGYNVLVPFYADRNGLPVEVQVEKAFKISAHRVASTSEGRLKFLSLCKEFLDEIEKELVKVWKRLGCSFQYWKDGTDSEEYRKITQATFIELFKKGLVYEAERPVNWCPRCKATLADAELEYSEEDTYLYYVKFPLENSSEHVVVATTRPELLRSCKALAFNPKDHRYAYLEGRNAINPLYGHKMPVLKHEAVDPEYGTGLVMICSYGDHADVAMFRDLKLEPTVIVDRSGYLTEEAGPLAGLSIDEARTKAVQLLEERGYIVKKEKTRHNVPVCWRCKTPIQIVHAREWFLKQLEFKDALLNILDQMEFKPEFHKVKLVEWIKNITTDWPISKDRYYATEVPVWRCKRCGTVLVPEPGRYYRPWIDPPVWDKCPKCGAPFTELEGERKVFDTWFDSSISVLYVTGYMRNNELFEKASRSALRAQGVDIVRTWLYYTILRVYQLTGRPAFKWIRLSGMGLDERGEAMHKSKGNIVDPEPILEKYGADAFRYWAAASAKLGYDYRYSEAMIKTGMLFATKLWNIARYISCFPQPEDYVLRPLDRSMLAAVNRLVVTVDNAYMNLDVYVPITEIYQFAWNQFASHYLELTKSRSYNVNNKYSEAEQRGAWYALHYTLKRILQMLAPIMPFVTDAIYRELYGKSVHSERFPEPDEEFLEESPELIFRACEVNHAIWKYKKQSGLKLSDPIMERIYLPRTLEPALEELMDLHGLKYVEFYEERPPEDAVDMGSGVYRKPASTI
ncbi:MAG: valine--tRNA ligase [Desulfurococcaceae archaeon]